MFWGKRITRKVAESVEAKSSTASQLVSPSEDFLSLFGVIQSAAGIAITPRMAMRVPAVKAAVQAIAEAIGQIEAHIFEVGSANKAVKHSAYALLNSSVNAWTSSSSFREQITRDALLFGNGYAAIVRDEDRDPVELHRMSPEAVSVLINPDTLEPSYQHASLGGQTVVYPFGDVLHIPTCSLDGLTGESSVTLAREAIGLALAMEAHASRLFSNGARPASALTVPGTLTPEAIGRLKASLQASHGGSNSGGTIVLEQGATFDQTALTSADAQFLEMRQFTTAEIARCFRINPILIGEMGRATFANSSEVNRQFTQYTLQPWTVRWAGEIALKLLRPEERALYRVELDTDGFDREGIAARATAYSSMIAARVMNPNECRDLESLPAYPDGNRFINPNISEASDRG